MALLYSNTARLMRLCAQVYGNCSKTTVSDSRDEFTEQEKICFYKVSAVIMYYNCGEKKKRKYKSKRLIEVYSEPGRTSKMNPFAKIFMGFSS